MTRLFESRGVYLVELGVVIAMVANSFGGADATKIIIGATATSVGIAVLGYKNWRAEQQPRHDCCGRAALYCLDGEP